jgi:hypothetical protein
MLIQSNCVLVEERVTDRPGRIPVKIRLRLGPETPGAPEAEWGWKGPSWNTPDSSFQTPGRRENSFKHTPFSSLWLGPAAPAHGHRVPTTFSRAQVWLAELSCPRASPCCGSWKIKNTLSRDSSCVSSKELYSCYKCFGYLPKSYL